MDRNTLQFGMNSWPTTKAILHEAGYFVAAQDAAYPLRLHAEAYGLPRTNQVRPLPVCVLVGDGVK